LPEKATKAFLCYNLYFAPEDFFQVEHEAGGKPGARHRAGVHQKIYVAIFASFASCDRTKHPDISRAVLGRDALNLVAFFLN
jgi:hypothetical protein